MESTQQKSFIQTKIEELGSAIFFNLSDAILKLPTSVVRKMKVDEFGYVWFCVQKPNQHLQEFEQEFPVRLDFFKKGMEYFLQVEGHAWVVNDPEEMNAIGDLKEDIVNGNKNDRVLVKVKILRADYHETKSSQGYSWWDHAVQTISGWLGTSQHYRNKNTYFPAS